MAPSSDGLQNTSSNMDHKKIASELERNRNVFQRLLHGLTAEEVRRRPGPNKWCLLEIICHLLDEEKEDFRMRTRLVLEDPRQDLPKIDPVSWVKERKYMEQDFESKLQEFLKERDRSVQWLTSLKNPDWKSCRQHPTLGPMTAGLFLSNWLAHDYLHLRQIIRLKFDQLQSDSGQDLTYAGSW